MREYALATTAIVIVAAIFGHVTIPLIVGLLNQINVALSTIVIA